jgi:nucleoid DNA-binding protein
MKLLDLYNSVAEKHNVTPELVKMIIESNFKYIATHIRERKSDEILIHNFGSFKLQSNPLDKIIIGYIKKYKSKKITKEELKEELTILFKLRRDLKEQRSKKKRKK